MELRGYITTENWGKCGAASSAAKLYWNTKKRNTIMQEIPYSEFIINPDPETECIIAENGQIFGKFLENDPVLLGRGNKVYNEKLPFVLSVLSIDKPMPLKVHPDKDQANKLYNVAPFICSDDNHKPKLIISLKRFEILCGLRPREEIRDILLGVPELSLIIPIKKQDNFIYTRMKIHLNELLVCWLNASEEQMKFALDMFFQRMDSEDLDVKLQYNFGLIKRLHSEHPYNPGVFAPYFLNHFTMGPNEAIFINSGVPYSLLSGNCIQVSGRSANEIKLAFMEGNKKPDPEAINIIDLNENPPETLFQKPTIINEHISSYFAPVAEFAVNKIEVKKNVTTTLPAYDTCSIFIVTRGKADCFIRPSIDGRKLLKMGCVIFVLPHQKITFTPFHDILLYQVYINARYCPPLFSLNKIKH